MNLDQLSLKKALSGILALSIVFLLKSPAFAQAPYPASAPFHAFFGVETMDEITGAKVVYENGTAADLAREDIESLLGAFWDFYMERFTRPYTEDVQAYYTFVFYTDEGSVGMIDHRGFVPCAKFGQENYLWYRPYIGNARNALYTASSHVAEKYSALAAPAEEPPYVPQRDVLSDYVDGASAWALPEITQAAQENILPLEFAGTYGTPISRGAFCLLAAHLINQVQTPSGGNHPYDLSLSLSALLGDKGQDASVSVSFPDDEYPTEAVRAMYLLGVVCGRDDGSFDPEGAVTREEAAKILYNCAALYESPQPASARYADDREIAPWARESVCWASQHHILRGIGDNRFAPKDTYTVEQAVATMLRLLRHLKPPA
ncbi:MAG: S-layer homology domain-containing protein [Clostridiales bacterium]|nr:S-layer homology domain-containing protein [Clostridiales bacterium]